jgi:hypothetical protein
MVALLLVVAAAPEARAHEYWLEAVPARAAAGEEVIVRAFVGTGFVGAPKLHGRARTAALLLAAARRVDLAPLAAEGSVELARIVAPDDSGFVVAFQSEFRPITLDGPRFDRYLAEEGLETVLALRAANGTANAPGRERYRRCVTTWVSGVTPALRRLAPLGLPCEIVALGDPSSDAAPAFRVLFEGAPLAGALVRAWRDPAADTGPDFRSAARDSTGPVVEIRTDARGEARLTSTEPGAWLVATVHMIPSRSPDADWESTWASITFRRPASPPATPGSSAPRPGGGRLPRP